MLRKALRGLVGQAVNQVHVDAVESPARAVEDQFAGHFEWLNAMNGLLHFGIEILDAHTQPIEAELPQSFQVRARW